jgi:ATP-grasp domain, R2K clade family 2
MITTAWIEERAPGRTLWEFADMEIELQARGVPTMRFTPKKLVRRRVALTAHTLVVGSIPTTEMALKQLGVTVPIPEDYPIELHDFLYRRVWKSTLRAVKERIECGESPVFIKPATRRKRFTGFVFTDPSETYQLEGASGQTPVWCSQCVEWQSEWRVFVLHGNILGIQYYRGIQSIRPEEDVIKILCARWIATGRAPCAFALDVGVLTTGETALVEVNDGFSLGRYGLPIAFYTNMVIARWGELMA